MRRFGLNRWWAHLLALGLVLGSTVGSAAQAGAVDRNTISRPDAIGRIYGDPDATTGTGRSPSDNGTTPTWKLRGTSEGTVGDGVSRAERWLGSLWFALEIAKTRWLR